MPKDIRTHEAKIDLVKKFLDYAECADASYARLGCVLYFIFGILVILLLNGCSFKLVDPQYAKFKKLCGKEAQGLILNDRVFNLYLKKQNKKYLFTTGINFMIKPQNKNFSLIILN